MEKTPYYFQLWLNFLPLLPNVKLVMMATVSRH